MVVYVGPSDLEGPLHPGLQEPQEVAPERPEGFRVLGFRGLGFRGLGFRGLGFKGLGFSVEGGNHLKSGFVGLRPLKGRVFGLGFRIGGSFPTAAYCTYPLRSVPLASKNTGFRV